MSECFVHFHFCLHTYPAVILSLTHNSLVFQCTNNGYGATCKALAQVYYLAVRAFGRVAGDSPAAAEYEAALATYEALIAEAIEKGEDPTWY